MDSGTSKQKQPLVEPYANLPENKSKGMQKSLRCEQKRWIYYIEERGREVAQMLAQGHSETELAKILHVHVSTICMDVKALKQLSQRFVFDSAKGDLTYYYKQCIDGMDEIRKWVCISTGTGVKESISQLRKRLLL
jgi:hypothetical protein